MTKAAYAVICVVIVIGLLAAGFRYTGWSPFA